ncbi:PAS domain-containing protein [Arthrobacter sp. MA-N2]|uniref:PAS domain-containing protein n=1 Tax=Arthrobacter sp. MA-N2 TaxID=1101188 RepID=UPI000483C266|nr:PAS domain-containing protein [Arthrobacter sp. MA-N2]
MAVPEELLGRPSSLVIGPEDLAVARSAIGTSARPGGPGWHGVLMCCRHRDASTVWLETSGRVRFGTDGQRSAIEGISRRFPAQTAQEAAAKYKRIRIREMIDGNALQTAFQPIHALPDR